MTAPAAVPSIPFDPESAARRRFSRLANAKAGLDFIAHNLPRAHAALVRLNPYPRPWRAVTLEMEDGARLAGWHGPGKPGAPALLFLPGTFQTKDDTPRKRRALGLWRRSGAHVLIVDQRGFGGSSQAPPSGGSREARDALVCARWIADHAGADRAIVWGESLGGAVALLAGCLDGAEQRLARVVAWSPFADLADASLAASADHRRGSTMLGRTYRWLLRRRDPRATDFRAYLELRAHELGVPLDDLLAAGSPARHVARLRVPALVLHAEDDGVVPVAHARRLQEARAPLLDVRIVPRGRHLEFDREAPRWFEAIARSVLA